MKLSEFIKITDSTRMAQRTKDAVRMVLVDGIRASDAARQMEMSKQQLKSAIERVEAAFKASRGMPDDWECITVCVPPTLISSIREIEHKAKRDAGLSVD